MEIRRGEKTKESRRDPRTSMTSAYLEFPDELKKTSVTLDTASSYCRHTCSSEDFPRVYLWSPRRVTLVSKKKI